MKKVKYSTYGPKGEYTHQMTLDDFIQDSFSPRYSDRDTSELKLDGSISVLTALIQLLLEKNILTIKDIEDLLPYSNNKKIISLDDDWD